jgi:hypothetical protein
MEDCNTDLHKIISSLKKFNLYARAVKKAYNMDDTIKHNYNTINVEVYSILRSARITITQEIRDEINEHIKRMFFLQEKKNLKSLFVSLIDYINAIKLCNKIDTLIHIAIYSILNTTKAKTILCEVLNEKNELKYNINDTLQNSYKNRELMMKIDFNRLDTQQMLTKMFHMNKDYFLKFAYDYIGQNDDIVYKFLEGLGSYVVQLKLTDKIEYNKYGQLKVNDQYGQLKVNDQIKIDPFVIVKSKDNTTSFHTITNKIEMFKTSTYLSKFSLNNNIILRLKFIANQINEANFSDDIHKKMNQINEELDNASEIYNNLDDELIIISDEIENEDDSDRLTELTDRGNVVSTEIDDIISVMNKHRTKLKELVYMSNNHGEMDIGQLIDEKLYLIKEKKKLIKMKNMKGQNYYDKLKKEIIKGFNSIHRIIILPVTLIDLDEVNIDGKGGSFYAHANVLIIDKHFRTIELFEPHGTFDASYDFSKTKTIIQNIINEAFPKPITVDDIFDSDIMHNLIRHSGGAKLQISDEHKQLLSDNIADKHNKNIIKNRSLNMFNNFKKRLLISSNLEPLTRIQIINEKYYEFFEMLRSLGREKVKSIFDEYKTTKNISADIMFKKNIIMLIDNTYINNLRVFNFGGYNGTIVFDGLGPQALSRDSYCYVWTILMCMIKCIDSDITLREAEIKLKSSLSNEFLSTRKEEIIKYKNSDFDKYLSLKYVQIPPNKILNRIESVIIWLHTLLNKLDIIDGPENGPKDVQMF